MAMFPTPALTVKIKMTATDNSNSARAAKSPIVLVHGAWHGGWCWRRVVPLLQAAGHEVFAPTLTGLADRAHLLVRAINLDTHIQDVIGLLESAELSNAVLVGHSYAGAVITGVADRAASHLSSLVYLDAFLPANGKRMVDSSIRHAARRPSRQAKRLVSSTPQTQRCSVSCPAPTIWLG